ncbi:MAG TPA: amidohydrolase family protein [Bauldia sp.]|nr:amidohydrolase family protein [Bauldia sp.]
MEIVDSQIHLWNGLLAGAESSRPSFTHTDLLPLMDEAGVNRVVLVPPSWAGDGNESSLAAARAYPKRFACMGRVDVEKPENKGTLAKFKAIPGMMGCRLAFRREPHATWLMDGTADWFWPEAAQAGLNVMVYAPGRLDVIAEKVRQSPKLRIIVDHMGLVPTARGAEREKQLAGLMKIASMPNFAVKLSALPLYSDEAYPHKDIDPIVRQVVDAFGAERCFWGSDFTRQKCTYRQTVEMVTDGMPFLDAGQKELIMGRAILDWLGWK